MKPLQIKLFYSLLCTSLLFALVGIQPAYAASIVVTSASSTVANDGVCTLKEAIQNANSDSQNGRTASGECAAGSGADTITFAGNYTINVSGSGYLPSITTQTTIDGSGHTIVIDANNSNRDFYVDSTGNLSLTDLTVQNGFDDGGGGIWVQGSTLTLTNVTMKSNTTSTLVGGGAILSYLGNVSVVDSTFTDNSSLVSGGAIENKGGTLTVTGSSFSGSKACATTVSVANGSTTVTWVSGADFSLVSGGDSVSINSFSNTVASVTDPHNLVLSSLYTGATDASATMCDITTGSSPGYGGAIYNTNSGTASVTNSTFTNNSAGDSGGGIYSDGSSLTVSGSTFSGNSAKGATGNGYGGGIDNESGTLTVTSSTFSSNSAIYGGGIQSYYTGSSVTNSTFSGNSADSDGGGIYSQDDLTVTNSTFSGNSAHNYSGGGIENDGGTLIVTNSTFSGNSAIDSGCSSGCIARGGGLSAYGTTYVINSTFSGNIADYAGGIYNSFGNTVNLYNTILANSKDGSGGAIADCYKDNVSLSTGTVTGDHNLIETDSTGINACGTTSPINNQDPNLGSLANNGGPTQTMALLAGSPAIDAGNNTVCAAAVASYGAGGLDQRGVTRPQGAACDIGAYEYGSSASSGNGNKNGNATTLPKTGFAPGVVTSLPAQPADKQYSSTDLILNIPALGVKTSIVGVPRSGDSWDVSWLGSDAGWLNGTAFPTWVGNSVITSHVWNADNTPGIFVNLKQLKYGDQIQVLAFGQTYTYAVRESRTVWPSQTDIVLQHEDRAYLTLLTCEDYNILFANYPLRRMVRAVLISVK